LLDAQSNQEEPDHKPDPGVFNYGQVCRGESGTEEESKLPTL